MATPLYVSAPPGTPRVSYTLDLVLSDLLGMPYQLLSPGDHPPEGAPWMVYGVPPQPGAFTLPWGGLLGETHIRQDPPAYWPGNLVKLFPQPPDTRCIVDFDLLSGVFYLVTDYEKYQVQHLDAHERYDLKAYPSDEWHLDHVPLVHRYAQLLGEVLVSRFPQQLEMRPPAFSAEITIDVDFPWKYRHKGPAGWGGGLLRDMVRLKPGVALERLQTLLTRRDPHDTFALLQEVCPPERTRFFFLVSGRKTPYDSRFPWTKAPYQKLIRQLGAAGYGLGIHPSYSTMTDPGQLARELSGLSSVLDQAVRHSRQHFLRYRLPETPRQLLEAGIRDDYSWCRYHEGGFPAGMARPFHWFDLRRNRVTTLKIHPAQLMDRSLQAYLGLEPEPALERFRQLLDCTRTVGGTFSMIFHNDSLSESGEWRGWRPAILAMMEALSV
ncbi:MAG: hypothetical protein D6722_28200 [Bacteroidetes bacterium]|nr:MAG: hypothetical protein D6722_28200 [Bacteroidota bacterium]